MAEHRYLPKAPIMEAVIEIRTIVPENFDISVFDSNEKLSQEGYKQAGVIKTGEIKFEFNPSSEGVQNFKQKILG